MLFKYSAINKYTFETLVNKQIYLSSPSVFNDPFDCGIQLRYDLMTEDNLKELHIVCIEREEQIDRSSAEKAYDEMLKSETLPTTATLSERQLENFQRVAKVFCLSSDSCNFLMWSHYSQNHTGICIAYDSRILFDEVNGALIKVKYSDDVPVLIAPVQLGKDEFFEQVGTKANFWKYEQEFRLIKLISKGLTSIPPTAIRQVIFGCRTSQADIDTITKLIDADFTLHHVRKLKAIRIASSFRLRLEELK